MPLITDGELAALEARMTAAREATDKVPMWFSDERPRRHALDLERLATDKRIAALEKEIKDHAEWAKGQMTNPNSEVYLKLTKTKLELEEAMPRLLAVVKAAKEYADTHFGMQVTGGNYMKVQRAKTDALKEALKGVNE